jgi:hypothetical protein
MGVGGQRHAAAVLPPGVTRWGPGQFWMDEENLAPTRIRSRNVQSVMCRYTITPTLSQPLQFQFLI